MEILLGLLAVLMVLDALRLRGRVGRLPRSESSTPPNPRSPKTADSFLVFAGDGVELADETVEAAWSWAEGEGAEVVDLVPEDLPSLDALALFQIVDPPRHRGEAFAKGQTAGRAMLVRQELANRMGLRPGGGSEPADLLRMARELKLHAPRTTGFFGVSRSGGARVGWRQRGALLEEALGWAAMPYLVGQGLFLCVLLASVWFYPLWGGLALIAFHLQPALALAGGPQRPSDLLEVTLLRLPAEAWRWLTCVIARVVRDRPGDPVEERRSSYEARLGSGVERFFEPRRSTCWVCGSSALALHLELGDVFQAKPGRFRLERCRSCEHVFQNPRLSLKGLEFYYGDFYDGLGEEPTARLFGHNIGSYHSRAGMLEGHGKPGRWLDVGGGHGHFCCAARDVWPDTEFHALDLSEAIEAAVHRGWADRGIRGLFPEQAAGLVGEYDVVSMSHYLEHVREPEEELEAAARVLAPEGHLFIELPDPESSTGRWLGEYWLPWFQPQHQNLLSAANLERLLAGHGFVVVDREWGDAHQALDLLFAVWMVLERLGPNLNRPWLPPVSPTARIRRAVVWTLGAPLLLAGLVADRLLAPVFRRRGLSNTYRLLARKDPVSAGRSSPSERGAPLRRC